MFLECQGDCVHAQWLFCLWEDIRGRGPNCMTGELYTTQLLL